MASQTRIVPKEVACVVCGLKSHRLDWQKNPNPACDSHTTAEVQAALQKQQPSPPASGKPATTPATPPPTQNGPTK